MFPGVYTSAYYKDICIIMYAERTNPNIRRKNRDLNIIASIVVRGTSDEPAVSGSCEPLPLSRTRETLIQNV